MRTTQPWAVGTFLVAAACATTPTENGEDDAEPTVQALQQRQAVLEERLAALDQRVEQLSKRVDRAGPGPAPALEAVRLPTARSVPELEAEIDDGEPPPRPSKPRSTTERSPTGASQAVASGNLLKEAQLSYERGEYESALLLLRQLSQRSESTAPRDDILYYRGACLHGLGEHAEAIDVLQRLLVRHPDSPHASQALLKTAESYWLMGDRISARAFLARVVEQFPNSPAARRAAELLKPSAEGR